MKPENHGERVLEEKWNKCKHVWRDTNVTIDTIPPQDVYRCNKCGATTHDIKTGEYCFIKHYF